MRHGRESSDIAFAVAQAQAPTLYSWIGFDGL